MKLLLRLARYPRLFGLIHRLFHHRTPKDQACRLCAAVWAEMEMSPGFLESLAAGFADLEAGRWYHYEPGSGRTTPNPAWPAA